MTKYIKFETDIAWDDSIGSTENLGTVLEEICNEVPSAFIRVIRLKGSGGGWPEIEVMVPKSDAEKVLSFFFDEIDIAWIIDESREFEVAQ